MFSFLETLTALLIASGVVSAPAFPDGMIGRGKVSPIMGGQDFPDPSIIKTVNGWYAFATNTKVEGKLIHVQIASSSDFQSWKYQSGKDALPTLPSWVDAKSPRVWAPDVIKLGDGSFILYYSAASKRKPKIHCVSYATSKNVDGPYVDSSTEPWICDFPKGGGIDASGYQHEDGTRWVVYKIDGNSVGHGGVCGNTVKPIVGTPIMLQQVGTDGHSMIGDPVQLITNGPLDGPVVEAPSLTKLGDKYVLFFSSNCYTTTKYDVSYAISTNLKGPYTKYGPLFVTGTDGLVAPGGLHIAVDGNHAIWHANHGKGRAAFTALLSLDGSTVTAATIS